MAYLDKLADIETAIIRFEAARGLKPEESALLPLFRQMHVGWSILQGMPQGASLARHGALGATKFVVYENDSGEKPEWEIDGDCAYDALLNALPMFDKMRAEQE